MLSSTMSKYIKIIFYSSISIFVFLILIIFTPLNEYLVFLFPYLFVVSFLLGIALLVLSKRGVKEEKLRRLLIINGISLAGIPLLSVLHNLFYALEQLVENVFLTNVISYLGILFFILSVIVCPIVFLGTIVWIFTLYLKELRRI